MQHDERAERTFHHRSLAKLADAIADPPLRAKAHGIASGAISAAEFLRHMENSAAGMRGFDRYLKRFMTLGPADLDRIAAQREQQISEIATELRAEQAAARNAGHDEQSWEEQSWLE